MMMLIIIIRYGFWEPSSVRLSHPRGPRPARWAAPLAPEGTEALSPFINSSCISLSLYIYIYIYTTTIYIYIYIVY